MTKAGVAPRFYEQPHRRPCGSRKRSALYVREAPDEYPAPRRAGLDAGLAAGAPSGHRCSRPTPLLAADAPPASRPQTVDRSTWERLAITPDIEIHVRRPLDRRSNKLVERLARIARDLFDDEP